MMKWSVYSEKGKFTLEVAGKHKVIFTLIENYPKISKYRIVQLMKQKGKCQTAIRYLAISRSLTIVEDIFAALPLAFSMINSPVW